MAKKKGKKAAEEPKEDPKEEVKEPTPEEAPVEKEKTGKYQAAVDINPQIRKGDEVPEEMVNAWKTSGIDYEKLVN